VKSESKKTSLRGTRYQKTEFTRQASTGHVVGVEIAVGDLGWGGHGWVGARRNERSSTPMKKKMGENWGNWQGGAALNS